LVPNFAVDYASREDQESHVEAKANTTQQLLVCADDVNLLRNNTHNRKKIQELLLMLERKLI
jgi:hypothetical protein